MAQNKLKISMFIKGINSLFSYNIKEKSKKGGGDVLSSRPCVIETSEVKAKRQYLNVFIYYDNKCKLHSVLISSHLIPHYRHRLDAQERTF